MMTSNRIAIALCAASLSLVGCGMKDALDATTGMPDLINKTNDQVHQTNAQVTETNRKMDKTNEAIHKQVLASALTEMLKPENTRYLLPPAAMLPAAQLFAKEVTADEVIELTYVYLQEINEVQPVPEVDQGPDGKYSPAFIYSFDHQKQVKFTAIQAIAGLVSQQLVQAVVSKQIDRGGRYQATANSFLALRFAFIKGIRLDEDLLVEPLDNVGKLKAGVEFTQYLDWIARRPDVANFTVHIKGMLKPDDNRDLAVDSSMLPILWKKLDKAVKKDLKPETISTDADTQSDLRTVLNAIKEGRDYWASHQ